jgi:hypothetical protein
MLTELAQAILSTTTAYLLKMLWLRPGRAWFKVDACIFTKARLTCTHDQGFKDLPTFTVSLR